MNLTTKPTELSDDALDISGGSDEQQKRSLHVFTAKPSPDHAAAKIPGMQKFSNVTLKRG